MNEVEKMYANAGIEKDWTAIGFGDIEDCYPPFTAEKQLRLLKKINKKWIIEMSYAIDAYYITAHSNNGKKEYLEVNNYFDEGLASIVNDLWQDLTEEERKQIKEILE